MAIAAVFIVDLGEKSVRSKSYSTAACLDNQNKHNTASDKAFQILYCYLSTPKFRGDSKKDKSSRYVTNSKYMTVEGLD